MGGKIRQRSVRERTRVGGESGGRDHLPRRVPEAGWGNRCPGASREGSLWVARPRDGTQAPVFRAGSAPVAGEHGITRRAPAAPEQDRRGVVVGVRQTAGAQAYL